MAQKARQQKSILSEYINSSLIVEWSITCEWGGEELVLVTIFWLCLET
jgi:hypothetical protein